MWWWHVIEQTTYLTSQQAEKKKKPGSPTPYYQGHTHSVPGNSATWHYLLSQRAAIFIIISAMMLAKDHLSGACLLLTPPQRRRNEEGHGTLLSTSCNWPNYIRPQGLGERLEGLDYIGWGRWFQLCIYGETPIMLEEDFSMQLKGVAHFLSLMLCKKTQ